MKVVESWRDPLVGSKGPRQESNQPRVVQGDTNEIDFQGGARFRGTHRLCPFPNVGKATALEAVGPTENTKGEAMLDKMQAKCAAVSIESGKKKYIDGACALTDSDGDVVFSTFDTRDLDKSQPEMKSGTHTITGGTGKYKGITGREAFACISKETPAGEPPGSFAIDIPHNATWEIKK
jgi:hypothetical protein